MKTWFEVKAKISQGEKAVTETYLFDSVSFTDAETKAYEELQPIKIEAIKHAKIAELLPFDSGDFWYKIGVNMVTLNESKGIEESMKLNYIIQANEISQALLRFKKSIDNTIVPYVITSIAITPIVEIFTYNESETEV